MSEDELLHTLGNLARFDERWDRLAAGTLTPKEDAELRTLAESDPEARAAYEAFRPLGGDFLARVRAAIEVPAAIEPPATTAAKVLPFERRRWKLGAWAASAAAIAALMLVFVRPAALPDYALAELSGGTSATRGTAATAWSPGDRFTVALRPQTGIRGGSDLEASAFLAGAPANPLRPIEIAPRFDEAGSVKVEGTLDPALAPGDWTLWLVVGRKGAAPAAPELAERLAGATPRGRGWVAVRVPLRIAPRAP